ncbi:MAG: Gldg family protein [Clostridia bacterium]|nr:Gldg family protein [Clostridia bacterium]
MKYRFSESGRASVSVAISVLVIVAVLLLNVGVSALLSRNLWFIDLTGYERSSSTTNHETWVYEEYTLTDEIVDFLDNTFAELNATRQSRGESPVEVEIVFCDDPDNLMKNQYQRMVYLGALQLQKHFPTTVTVKTIDVYKNQPAVQKYKTNSYTTIYPTTVIVSSGTEVRRLSTSSFFYSDSTTGELWASGLEVKLASAIRAVTKAASPKCILLTGHGESGYSDAFVSLLTDAGYEVIREFDLATQDIPEDCRLVVCCGPTSDFSGYNEIQSGEAAVSEIAKLDAFLDDENSLMVFFDPDTPVLPNLEEYLERWGVSICRKTNLAGEQSNLLIKDPVGALSRDEQTFVASYVTEGLGASMTAEMQGQSYPAKVVFPNATALTFSPSFKMVYMVEDSSGEALETPYSYATSGANNMFRHAFNMFTSPVGCVAYADGVALGNGEDAQIYSLMTISQETVTSAGDVGGNTTVSHDSNVVVCASTDILSDTLLEKDSYGNADMLSGLVRTLGVDPMTAKIDQYLKPLVSDEVEQGLISTERKKNTTVALALIPAVLLFGTGILVMTRRKYS